jgi:hypothetical protein
VIDSATHTGLAAPSCSTDISMSIWAPSLSSGSHDSSLKCAAQAAVHRHRLHEAHLVEAVVHAHRAAADLEGGLEERWTAGSASGSRARWGVPNGPVLARSGSTWIHWWSPVRIGELVDALLVDQQPVAGADRLAHQGCRSARVS